MGKYGLYIRQSGSRHTKQRMIHRKKGFCHNVVVITGQQIVHVDDSSRGGILNRHHRVIRVAQLHLLHGVLEACHMIDFSIPSKILNGCRMAVGTFHALMHHAHSLYWQSVQLLKAQLCGPAMLCQDRILVFAADGHHLGEQLPHRDLVKVTACHGTDRLQLLLLALCVIDSLSGGDLGLCHLAADIHALLE